MSVKALKPVPTWLVSQGYDWATISIDEETGVVAITSSYGNYNYIWRAIGSKTLLEFVCGINFDYAMGKFLGMEEWVNEGRTIQNFKEVIIEARRLGDVEMDKARDCWDEIKDLDCDGVGKFSESFWETEFGQTFECWHEVISHQHPPQARMFWDTLWAEFVKEVSP